MPELRIPPLRELAPLPGQAEAALALVHQRRRRSAITFGSTATAALLLVALLSRLGPGGTSGIAPVAPGVARTATAVPSQRGHGGETHRVTGPRLATVDEAPRAAPMPSPAVTPLVVRDPAEAFVRYRPRAPIAKGVRQAGVTETCPTRCSSWDFGYAGGRLTFHFEQGELRAAGAMPTYFPSEQELDLVITTADGTEELWRWGAGQTFVMRSHYIEPEPDTRMTWDGWWDLVLDDGTRLPPGDYGAVLRLCTEDPSEYRRAFRVEADGSVRFPDAAPSVVTP